jgi:hypothetical protein
MTNTLNGRWRIVEMELWDQDFVDAEVEGFIKFNEDGMGEFQFGYVHRVIDGIYSTAGKVKNVNFSWQGNDEMDPASGRGTATIKDGKLNGHIYFHQGNYSEFIAVKSTL